MGAKLIRDEIALVKFFFFFFFTLKKDFIYLFIFPFIFISWRLITLLSWLILCDSLMGS